MVPEGGSTRIPRMQSMIQKFFTTKEPNRPINPDEAVDVVLQCRAQSSQ